MTTATNKKKSEKKSEKKKITAKELISARDLIQEVYGKIDRMENHYLFLADENLFLADEIRRIKKFLAMPERVECCPWFKKALQDCTVYIGEYSYHMRVKQMDRVGKETSITLDRCPKCGHWLRWDKKEIHQEGR